MLSLIPKERVAALHSPQEHALLTNGPAQGPSSSVNAICAHMTPRQRQVLAVMMQGKSNKAICRALNLAEPTVKNHVTAILKALNVSTRTEAVVKVTTAAASSLSCSYTIATSYSTTWKQV
jgi:DNA-binding NarL/FixJ family response regulator